MLNRRIVSIGVKESSVDFLLNVIVKRSIIDEMNENPESNMMSIVVNSRSVSSRRPSLRLYLRPEDHHDNSTPI